MIDVTLSATRPSRHGNRNHKGAAWLALSALLFNLAAGYFLPATAQGALLEADIDGSLSSGIQVICTPNGLRLVRMGPDGEPLPGQPLQNTDCVYCLPCNMGQTILAGAHPTELVPLFTAERITYPVYSLASSSGGSFGEHPIRAPPQFQ